MYNIIVLPENVGGGTVQRVEYGNFKECFLSPSSVEALCHGVCSLIN